MPNRIHAHQVLDLIGQQPAPLYLEELRDKVTVAFGSNLEFVNCHEDLFTFDQLVDFMQERQKIVLHDGAVELNRINICKH